MIELDVDWALWADRALWTAGTLLAAWLIGHILNLFVARLVHLAAKTKGEWDDILIDELKRGMPTWSVLVGAWVASGHWQLRPDLQTLLHQVLVVLAGLSLTWTASRIVTRLVVSYSKQAAPTTPVSGLTQNLARILVLVLGGLMIVRSLGVDITPMLTALGIGGLAVALALQEPLSNLFAGLFLSLAGQVKIGDFVKLEDGSEGYVVDIDWRATRVRMLANNVVLVPNARLAGSIVINYSRPEQMLSVVVQVGVDYASDLQHVERVTIEVAKAVMQEVEGGISEFDPVIRYHTFGDSSINFSVVMRAKEFANQFLLKHEFVKRLHDRYGQEGIGIPFPIRTLETRGPIPVSVVHPDH